MVEFYDTEDNGQFVASFHIDTLLGYLGTMVVPTRRLEHMDSLSTQHTSRDRLA